MAEWLNQKYFFLFGGLPELRLRLAIQMQKVDVWAELIIDNDLSAGSPYRETV